jgi:hypothetical protein
MHPYVETVIPDWLYQEEEEGSLGILRFYQKQYNACYSTNPAI